MLHAQGRGAAKNHPRAQTGGSPEYDHRSRTARSEQILGAQMRRIRIDDARFNFQISNFQNCRLNAGIPLIWEVNGATDGA